MQRAALGFVQAALETLALVFFAHVVLTGIGYFAVPFALLMWGAGAAGRKRRALSSA